MTKGWLWPSSELGHGVPVTVGLWGEAMRQIWISKKGPPEVLQVREAADPAPGPSQVRVRVRAAGINFADLAARQGVYPDAPPIPCVVGYEVSGVIDAVGANVAQFKPGDRVF